MGVGPLNAFGKVGIMVRRALKGLDDPPELAEFIDKLDTPQKVANFHAWASRTYSVNETVFLVLVAYYKAQPKRHKRQVQFLRDVFLNEKDEALARYQNLIGGFNTKSEVKNSVKNESSNILKTKTFLDKNKEHGFVGALKIKFRGNTEPSENLFDELMCASWLNLQPAFDNGDFNFHDAPQPLAVWRKASVELRKDITEAGWDAYACGI